MAQAQLLQSISPAQAATHNQGYDYDLVIVGGGIAGLTLASALKDSGLSVLLVEAKVESAAVCKGQAYAVHMLSALIFQGIGVWDKILPQIEVYRRVCLSDADYPDVVEFATADIGTKDLGYVAEHQALLYPLQEFVQNCPNVTYLCPAEVVSTNYDRAFAKLLTLKLVAGNIGSLVLWHLSNQRNLTTTLLTKNFGLAALLQFYLYRETAAGLSGQPPTKKPKLYVL
jgi:hypothetical protein